MPDLCQFTVYPKSAGIGVSSFATQVRISGTVKEWMELIHFVWFIQRQSSDRCLRKLQMYFKELKLVRQSGQARSGVTRGQNSRHAQFVCLFACMSVCACVCEGREVA